MNYIPDNWVVIKIDSDDPHYRILAGWSGGFIHGSSWKMNSGIVRIEETETHFDFYGSSGSIYSCHKETYGLRMNNAFVWDRFKEMHKDKVNLMPETTNWLAVDWIIGK